MRIVMPIIRNIMFHHRSKKASEMYQLLFLISY